jgi:chromosome segregation ATPase
VSGEAERAAELERRLEELRRINERLGRELVEARAGRRPTLATTAARKVATLTEERNEAQAELAELRPELEWLRTEHEVLRHEVERLRGGYAGLLRRARARLLRR